ncbi:S-layer homology domain-containing protein [Demequina sp.]|uniref:CAP and S-layer homology domain-containing protein n=1 Tax=Demequina sp. TaxID=2050685 RepID=UPI0025FA572F|nr:S-layer homology domain-containing protein [Demequina sp.]
MTVALSLAFAAPAQALSSDGDDILSSTNSWRNSNGRSSLAELLDLNAVAQNWAEYLAKTRVLKHNPDVSSQIPSGWSKWGENVAYACGYSNPAAVIMNGWKNSPGHNANMLDSGFKQIGIGVATDSSGCTWAVQNFATYSSLSTGGTYSGSASLSGSLNVPASWGGSTVCVGAYPATTTDKAYLDPAGPQSYACGAPGSTFTIGGLAKGKSFHLRFIGRKATSSSDFSNGWPARWWGASENTPIAATITLPADNSSTTIFFFDDVSKSTSGFSSIVWMGDEGVSTGYSNGDYGPTDSVTRRQMAQFMYRLMDRPGFHAPSSSLFPDVKSGTSGYVDIQWMAVEGITTGYSDGLYRPDSRVTRKQMAQFLYRLAGSPGVNLPSKSPFPDVSPSESGYAAIVWMSQKGLAGGYEDGRYKPSYNVTRGHMALFMKRYNDAGLTG